MLTFELGGSLCRCAGNMTSVQRCRCEGWRCSGARQSRPWIARGRHSSAMSHRSGDASVCCPRRRSHEHHHHVPTFTCNRPAIACVTVSCNTMPTMVVLSVTLANPNEGVAGVVINAATYLLFCPASGIGVRNLRPLSSLLDLSRSEPTPCL
jgi:hypothetical protein